ncbi:MAG: alpha-L-fucosidase [Clostridia bacterium]|nr:alpha-L-fucosidase [Clostridia bacterium]
MGNYEETMERTKWYRDARFGMFIHWGLYSVPARHEWVKSREKMTDEQYQKYFDEFTAENYDPKEWAKTAKKAGMKYAVLTTKHHEGFCLFDSKYTDYKATNTPAGRDLVKEFVEAFRAEGIKVGFYYSLLDWHHPDYPHYGDAHHPLRDDPTASNENRDFSRYVEYFHNQVRELLTNYGKIDIMWFDFSYDSPNGESMRGEKWEATKLVKMIRKLQPEIIIDDRLGYKRDRSAIDFDAQPVYAGDFLNPEQYVPDEGMKDVHGRPIPWEVCMTTQVGSWGYVSGNEEFVSSKEIVRTLVDCVSNNGNYLLNVGPDSKGEFPEKVVKIFSEVGDWMKENGQSIYGCGGVDLPRPKWGRYTTDGKYVYAHLFDKFAYVAQLDDRLTEKFDYALFLKDNSEVKTGFWNGEIKGVVINLERPLIDQTDTVVKIALKK